MKPEDTLKKTTAYLQNLEDAKRLALAVGLPKGKATSKIYGDGMTVVSVAAIHEYGAGNNPTRSFLRIPYKIKKDAIRKLLISLFKGVAEKGLDASSQLEKAGVVLQNISKEAFETKGYGTWPDIKPSTKARKGSSAPLIDTGILRGSITYEVRRNAS
jgi:phage gpG-like protein